MTPHPVVYLGPSLSRQEAKLLLPGADIVGPARAGDIYRAVQEEGRRCIVLIDGLFGTVPAVWHKEILFALEHGCQVLGGGSMGALRAAECAHFGMVGVGRIFVGYRDGLIVDDAEVALVHLAADMDYQPITVPLVQIRFGLEDAISAGMVDLAEAESLFAAAEALFFMDRSWEVLEQRWSTLLSDERRQRLQEFLRVNDPKADDARAVLAVAASPTELRPSGAVRVERTSQWRGLIREVGFPETTPWFERGAPGRMVQQTRRVLAETMYPRDPVTGTEQRLLAVLAKEVAVHLGLSVDQSAVQRAADRVRRLHGLFDVESTMAWLESRGIDIRLWQEELAFEVLLERLAIQFGPELRAQLPLLLTRADRWEAVNSGVDVDLEDAMQFVEEEGLMGYLGATDLETLGERLGLHGFEELVRATALAKAERST